MIKKTNSTKREVIQPVASLPDKNDLNQKWYLLFLFVTTFLFYGNSCFNDYCLDDTVVIVENTSTQKGFAGISEHINQDLLYGYTHVKGKKAANAGWRPLSLITYSIEVGIFGKNHPGISHFINVLLFAAIVVLLYLFLKKYLIKNHWISFLTALLFAVHPIHTEVVANIKSRDELLCLLFILLTLIYLWKFLAFNRNKDLILSFFFYFLSFTSKETGITFLLGIPVMLYFTTDLKLKKIFTYTTGFILIAIVYLGIRNAIVPFTNIGENKEIINNAYLNASFAQALATKFFVLLLYLKLLFYPNPLSYDYSYNQIPYQSFGQPVVILSIALYLLMLGVVVYGFKKKNMFSFCIAMFLITLSIGSNLFIEIGMMMGERLVFIPSIFFLLGIVSLGSLVIEYFSGKMKLKSSLLTMILIIPVVSIGAIQTISRNGEWKNNQTLPLADIVKNPESARVNCAAGGACLYLYTNSNQSDKEVMLSKAITYLKKSITIYPEYNDALLDLGFAYNLKNDFEKADLYWKQVRQRTPNHPKLKAFDKFLSEKYLNTAIFHGSSNSADSAIYYYNKSAEYSFRSDSAMLVIYYNLGGLYYDKSEYQKAYESLQKVISIDPNYSNAKQGLIATEQMMKEKNIRNLNVEQ